MVYWFIPLETLDPASSIREIVLALHAEGVPLQVAKDHIHTIIPADEYAGNALLAHGLGSVVYLAFLSPSTVDDLLADVGGGSGEEPVGGRVIWGSDASEVTPTPPASSEPIGVALWMDGLNSSMTDYEIKRWMFRRGLGNTLIRGLRVIEDEGDGLMAYIEVDNPEDIEWLVRKFGASEIMSIPAAKGDNRVVEHDGLEHSIDGLIEGIS